MSKYNICFGEELFYIIDPDNQALVKSLGDSGEAKHRISKVNNILNAHDDLMDFVKNNRQDNKWAKELIAKYDKGDN